MQYFLLYLLLAKLPAFCFLFTDCSDVFFLGHRTSGVYQVKPGEKLPLDNIYCEFVNNTGYTVMQRRADGLLSFNRGWLEYKVGFGNLYGDFWLGNDIIHSMTTRNKYGLRIDLWDWEGNKTYAEYSEFYIENEEKGYQLHLNGYSGNAGDSLSYHDKMKFSTEDLDNDRHMRNCAAENKAGWWFDSCYLSDLNGVYHIGWYSQTQSTFADGIVWYTLKDSERYSVRKVEMKLKRQA